MRAWSWVNDFSRRCWQCFVTSSQTPVVCHHVVMIFEYTYAEGLLENFFARTRCSFIWGSPEESEELVYATKHAAGSSI